MRAGPSTRKNFISAKKSHPMPDASCVAACSRRIFAAREFTMMENSRRTLLAAF
jgi:hypothetical protein